VPWAELAALIEPHYPKAGNGRPLIGLQRTQRIHLLRHWFNRADEAMGEALYGSASLRALVGIDLGLEPVPDATSLLRFRHLIEKHRLGEALFAEVGQLLQAKGLKLSGDTWSPLQRWQERLPAAARPAPERCSVVAVNHAQPVLGLATCRTILHGCFP
jgi:IS5 family transposase